MPRKILKFEQRVGRRLPGLLLVQRTLGALGLGIQAFDPLLQIENRIYIKVFAFQLAQMAVPFGPRLCRFFGLSDGYWLGAA